jgi:predicted Fe-Mo cluster-binding NifX family protein
VASETGENIDACFGKTGNFRIYQLTGEGEEQAYELLEVRPGPRPCQEGSHDEAVLDASAEILKDCDMVLAGRVGPAAVKALADRGVMALAAHLPITDALKRLAKR